MTKSNEITRPNTKILCKGEVRKMNELQIFNNEEFGNIRTVTIDNEP